MSIIVFSENRTGKIKKHSLDAVAYAAHISKSTSQPIVAISIGNVSIEELAVLAKYGASKIISVNKENWQNHDSRAYTKLIAEIVEKENANMVIFNHSNIGKALAPRLSVRLKAGLASNVVALPVTISPLVFTRKSYNGSAFQHMQINSAKCVVTLNPNSCEVTENQVAVNIVDYTPTVEAEIKTKVENVDLVTGKILLTEASIVVSGGRGLKSGDNWKPVEELAAALGAGLACSRPVSDEGWRSHEEHVGQTGKIIAPDLYIAIGISGAIQHIGGISGTKVIVAIDKDKDAPIFSYANYGIIGDAFTVLPNLINSVKKFKAQ